MAYGQKETTIFLTNVDWCNDYKDVMLFDNESDQINWFKLNPATYSALSTDDYRFIDGAGFSEQKSIKVSMRPEVAQGFNYLFYRNSSDSSWRFCFIKYVNFVDYETAEIFLELDIFQTYQFKFELADCFIKRETVKVDNVFNAALEDTPYNNKHEMLISKAYFDDGAGFRPYVYAVNFKARWNHEEEFTDFNYLDFTAGDIYQTGVNRNGALLVFDNFSDLTNFIYGQQSAGINITESFLEFGIVSNSMISSDVCICRSSAHNSIELKDNTVAGYNYMPVHDLPYYNDRDRVVEINKPQELKTRTGGTYSPHNEKCLMGPYQKVKIKAMNYEREFYFEDFNTNSIASFEYCYSYTNGFKMYVYPKNYKKQDYDFAQVIELPISATFPYLADQFHDWLVSNSNMIAAKQNDITMQQVGGIAAIIGGAVQIGVGAFSGGGLIATGLASAAGGISSLTDASNNEDELRGSIVDQENKLGFEPIGTATDSLFTLSRRIKPTVELWQTDGNLIKKIDNYYSAFGYNVSRFDTPKLHNRANWDYLQLGKCNIKKASSSSTYMSISENNAIKKMFENGIRIWHTYKKKNEQGDYEWNFSELLNYGNFENPII